MTTDNVQATPPQGEALSQLVDAKVLQNLVQRFADFAGLPVAVLERPGGRILASTGRRLVCEQFHRKNTGALLRCRESRRELAKQAASAHGATILACPNGLMEGVCPVVIEGRRAADLLAGQVFFEPPDEEVFRRQGRECGFDEAAYLAAVREVPVMARERLEQALELLAGLAEAIASAGLGALRALRAETRLRTEEQKYRQLVAEAQTAILKLDPEGRVAFLNEYGQRLFGYSEQEILGRPAVGTIMPERDLAGRNMRAVVELALRSRREGRGEREGVRQDGARLWCDWTVKPLFDDSGELEGYLCVVSDVTERKMAEIHLQDAVNELTTIFQNSLVGVVFLRGGRNIAKINRRMAEIMGYEEDEMVGHSVEMFHLSPEHFEEFGRRYYNSLSQSELIHVEYPLRRKDGSPVWCLLSGKALKPPDLEQGVIWVVDDISSRKELEQLKEDVERMARHDLKTPLNSLVTIPQVVLEDENLTEDQRKLLRLVRDAGYRMLDMINLSLVMFRMEQGEYQVEPANVDLVSVARRIGEELDSLMRSRQLGLEVLSHGAPAEGPFVVQGENLLLYSMLSNLIKNALEASPSGGVAQLDLQEDRDGYRITVRNQGEAPEAVRDRFFEKYATHGKRGGAGLGAYSARLIARTHGGDIALKAYASATEVEVRLPRMDVHQADPPLFKSRDF
jgi:PAS domain S-box-containing protein